MIDIHHHLLWDLDDGPADLLSALELAQAAVEEGITHVVCTPHANSRYEFKPDINRQKLAEIQGCMGDQLKLGIGCDFHLDFDNVQDFLVDPAKFTINGGKYLLVEFSDFDLPPAVDDIFCQFLGRGVIPIVTHPERNPIFQARPGRLGPWLRMGCLLQITAASLVGGFGKKAERFAWNLLDKHWISFVATDAHNLTSRPPRLRAAYNTIAKRMGSDSAELLCVTNPLAAFESRPLDPQPEPEDIDHDRQEASKSGFLKSLLRGSFRPAAFRGR